MTPKIIARNYAETLFDLAMRHGGDPVLDRYGAAIDLVARLLADEPLVRDFLESPRVELDAKREAMNASFRGRVPELFLRFLLVVIENRRQGVLPEIAEGYHELVDRARGRVRAEVTLAREADEELRGEIVAALERRLGSAVVATFRTDPALVGGIVIRVGGEILDGSLRRRTAGLRRSLLQAHLPRRGAARGAA